jgi:hypothetical protein
MRKLLMGIAAAMVPRNALRVTGEVRYFGVRGESGRFLIEASAQTVVRDYLASRTSSQNLWWSWLGVYTIQAVTSRQWIFTRRVRNRGIT